MYVQSFSVEEISALIRKADWRKYHSTYSQATRKAIIQEAATAAATSLDNGCSLTEVNASGRRVYKFQHLKDELVVRKLAANLRSVTKPFLSTRDALICSLRGLLAEGSGSRLYRLDLKKFYESFDAPTVVEAIDSLDLLSARSRAIFAAVMGHHASGGGSGIPAGLEISSLVAEYMMRPFDQFVRGLESVYFYGRFVDDMVVITQGNEDPVAFVSSLESALPNGTSFARKGAKFSVLTFGAAGVVAPSTQQFDYLGYKFKITDPSQSKKARLSSDPRQVRLDYSTKTLGRMKVRLVKSFLAYQVDKDFALLESRIKFLTQNVRMGDSRTNITKLVGVRFNHPRLTPYPGCGLEQLDSFLRLLVEAKTRPSKTIQPPLDQTQQRVLLRCNFSQGFADARFTYFGKKRLSEISKCWKYVS